MFWLQQVNQVSGNQPSASILAAVDHALYPFGHIVGTRLTDPAGAISSAVVRSIGTTWLLTIKCGEVRFSSVTSLFSAFVFVMPSGSKILSLMKTFHGLPETFSMILPAVR